jgi:hypothetical protein
MEGKIVEFKDGKVLVKFEKSLDPNKDGEPLGSISLNLEIDIAELPDEAYDYWKSKKAE